jgi:hypothetical protein
MSINKVERIILLSAAIFEAAVEISVSDRAG